METIDWSDEVKHLKARIAELELEIAARDILLGKITDYYEIKDCDNCTEHFNDFDPCSEVVCKKNMLALARAEIMKGRGK